MLCEYHPWLLPLHTVTTPPASDLPCKARGDWFLLVIKSPAYLALHAFSSHLGEGGKYILHGKELDPTIGTGSDQSNP
ncbi:hypothetical protein TSMEX_010232 [Taenia solium]|eukprot:TsM_000166400 transcript=TsM_000166400 gene=TsM_000166400